jgi:hypothetical protein
VTIYQITLRGGETRTVVGYCNGAWTTDRRFFDAGPIFAASRSGAWPDS